MNSMSVRERWRAALRLEPVDRLPFWPKLNPSYVALQSGAFASMSVAELQDYIGADPHLFLPGALRETSHRCSRETVTADGCMQTFWRTPDGNMTAACRWDPVSQAWHPTEYPVKSAADVRLMESWFDDLTVEIDSGALATVRERVAAAGETAMCATSVGTSALMDWIQHLAGPENGHFLLADREDEVTALFAAMHRVNLRRTELIAASTPCEVVYFIENTSTSLLSPAQYRRYCQDHIQEYGEILRRAGKVYVLHMCGLLQGLLSDLAAVPAHGFEAFTSPPVGDTTFATGRGACPDKCLIGGTSAATWLKPAERICAEIGADLDALPHHRGLVVTSAGVMPPACPPGVIRDVCRFVQQYPIHCG